MKSRHDDKSVKHWEKRNEEKWDRFQFNQPYAKGLKRLKDTVLEKTNFDPAVLWQWGAMQAMAVIRILKNAEARFGAEGQKLVLDSLHQVGYDVGKQITEGTEMPPDMTEAEWLSFFATVVNRIAYASLETPAIQDEGHADFHIDWCPHQDIYGAFDCRVQRYFVQGMMDAAADFAKSLGRTATWDVAFKTTIPAGAETCWFTLWRGDAESSRKWGEYTRWLEEKALERAAKKKQE